jgi:hypothetical protein
VSYVLTFFGGFAAATVTAAVVARTILGGLPPPPPVEPAREAVVRMLDVTIKDSNTTGRRQRFVCNPTNPKEKP